MSANGTELEIREMELEDIAPVFRLGLRLFTADRWPTLYRTWDESEVLNLYATSAETCLVADLGERRAGFALGTVLEKRSGPWTYGYLAWLGVDPSIGRRGIGGRLLERLQRVFIDQGVRMLMVDTEADNEPALRLFRKHGFGNDRDHVYLTKNLTHDPTYIRKKHEEHNGQHHR
jgi:ribosomal protein S18 acetylase RimI-like enzyme